MGISRLLVCAGLKYVSNDLWQAGKLSRAGAWRELGKDTARVTLNGPSQGGDWGQGALDHQLRTDLGHSWILQAL